MQTVPSFAVNSVADQRGGNGASDWPYLSRHGPGVSVADQRGGNGASDWPYLSRHGPGVSVADQRGGNGASDGPPYLSRHGPGVRAENSRRLAALSVPHRHGGVLQPDTARPPSRLEVRQRPLLVDTGSALCW